MVRQHGARPAVSRLVGSSSWVAASSRGVVGLAIITAGLPVLAWLALQKFQVLEEDVRGTFWASARGYALAYCDRCQRQRIIPVRKSELARRCSGGKFFHRHTETTMVRFASGSDGFHDDKPWL
jgi:hypothetical protein